MVKVEKHEWGRRHSQWKACISHPLVPDWPDWRFHRHRPKKAGKKFKKLNKKFYYRLRLSTTRVPNPNPAVNAGGNQWNCAVRRADTPNARDHGFS